jgi:hypothetical protein
MSKTTTIAKNLEVGDIIFYKESPTVVKFVNVGPKSVYVKTYNGKALSFLLTDKLEVYK